MHHPGHHTRPPVCILDTGEAQSGDVPQNAGTDTAASRRLPSWSRRLLPYIPWSFPDNRVQSTSESYCKVQVNHIAYVQEASPELAELLRSYIMTEMEDDPQWNLNV